MALALHEKGYEVSGRDDEINEPSKTRLAKKGLLPEAIGWFPEKINKNIDAIILGMHARSDNPELIKAKELGIKIYSYPEFIYEATKEKTLTAIRSSVNVKPFNVTFTFINYFVSSPPSPGSTK